MIEHAETQSDEIARLPDYIPNFVGDPAVVKVTFGEEVSEGFYATDAKPLSSIVHQSSRRGGGDEMVFAKLRPLTN